MTIKEAIFIKSSRSAENCPPADKPEYAFVGRSNVGKSSLLNMLTNNQKLAKVSATPGKTQLINHFLIDKAWYLTDLPGYGYARLSKKAREEFSVMIKNYLLKRQNLECLFILIDSRIKPQKNDLDFIDWVGLNNIPFVLCFTKADKLGAEKINSGIKEFSKELLKTWDSLPEIFVTSSKTKRGRDEILSFIQKINLEIRE